MQHDKSFLIEFQPLGLRDRFPSTLSLLEAARQKEIGLLSLCGGIGTCGKCRIQIVKGRVSKPFAEEREQLRAEEVAKGYRLACKTRPKSDLVLNIPSESLSAPQRLQVEGSEMPVTPDPSVTTYAVSLEPPSLSDLRGDDQRLLDALKEQHGISCREPAYAILKTMSPLLRSTDWKASVAVQGAEIISVAPQGTQNLGLAVDLGTTKIAGYLVDLESGTTLSARGIMNPQISYGEDVIARMVYAQKSHENAENLQHMAVKALNGLLEDLLADAGIHEDTQMINGVVVAGNTAMHHLLLNLPVKQLARAPYVPAASGAVDVKGRVLGLSVARDAHVRLLPNIAGFVGGDHLAMLLAVGAHRRQGPMLALDIGTNTEISLAIDGIIHTLSCASGPAFEGAHISCGMRAAEGAIEHVRILQDRFSYHVIGDVAPVGICGSGIFDALAQLFSHGIIQKGGKIEEDHSLVREGKDGLEVVLVDDVNDNGRALVITQKDVRELQLAKGAIRAGVEVLLDVAGLSPHALREVVVAGAFGSYLDMSSAVSIGMLPGIPLNRFRQVGNAAGMGARAVLLSRSKGKSLRELARKVRYVELATYAGFQKIFAEAMNLG